MLGIFRGFFSDLPTVEFGLEDFFGMLFGLFGHMRVADGCFVSSGDVDWVGDLLRSRTLQNSFGVLFRSVRRVWIAENNLVTSQYVSGVLLISRHVENRRRVGLGFLRGVWVA